MRSSDAGKEVPAHFRSAAKYQSRVPKCLSVGTVEFRSIRLVTRGVKKYTLTTLSGGRFYSRSGRNDRHDPAPVGCSTAGECSGRTGPFAKRTELLTVVPPSPTPERPAPPPAAHFFEGGSGSKRPRKTLDRRLSFRKGKAMEGDAKNKRGPVQAPFCIDLTPQ